MSESAADRPSLRLSSLLLLRVTIGLLIVWWGVDKLRDPTHGQKVAEKFYLGLGTGAAFLRAAGVAELLLGVLVMLGAARRFSYPALLFVTGVTALGVWRSIVDPWGLLFEGSVVLFYPSIIVFAGALVLMAFQSEDRLALK